MSREAGDFADVRGDVAFLNGIYTAYVEEILFPALKQDPMIYLGVDIFYHAGSEFIEQMRESVHFHMLPADALFLVFESEVMLLTVGYDD